MQPTLTLAAIVGALIFLYVLIKGHLYLTRKVWTPVFEEERAANEAESEEETGEDSGGSTWDEIR